MKDLASVDKTNPDLYIFLASGLLAVSPLFNIWPDIDLVGETCPGLGMQVPVCVGNLRRKD